MTAALPVDPVARLRVAVADMVAAMPDDVRAEALALHRLGDPEVDGFQLHWQPDRDAWFVSWGSVPLGEVSRSWLNGESDPESDPGGTMGGTA